MVLALRTLSNYNRSLINLRVKVCVEQYNHLMRVQRNQELINIHLPIICIKLLPFPFSKYIFYHSKSIYTGDAEGRV